VEFDRRAVDLDRAPDLQLEVDFSAEEIMHGVSVSVVPLDQLDAQAKAARLADHHVHDVRFELMATAEDLLLRRVVRFLRETVARVQLLLP
jgi:hypothetical protein